MSNDNTNTQESNSNNSQQSQPVTPPQTSTNTERQFIHVDTAENSRLNKAGENEFEIKSNSKIEK